jgi:hypothetical protein
MMVTRAFLYLCLAVSLPFLQSACSHTYHEEKLAESIQKICFEEYGIERVEVKTVGKTLGVYLPLEKLFSTDFEQILSEGKVKDLSSLLQFSPEALDKVEDVLFSTSRVILSTDKPIDFYVLHATDTELTGITLVLVGYVDDIERVRFWDISRSEYRKRVFHDVKVNYPVIWKKPVSRLFQDLGRKPTPEILEQYFLPGVDLESLSPLFYTEILEAPLKENLNYKISEIKATGGKSNEALVYAKILGEFTPKKEYGDHKFIVPSGYPVEYIFVLNKYLGEYRIARAIPFFYVGEDGTIKEADFPRQAQIYESLDEWPSEFELAEVRLSDFLAGQITRRVQSLFTGDERIDNTFARSRVSFRYEEPVLKDQPGYFTFEAELLLRKLQPATPEEYFANEDVQYALGVVLREFAAVLRGYFLSDYQGLKVILQGGVQRTLTKEDLELFRRKKIQLGELFARGI